MASESERSGEPLARLDLVESIRALAAKNARAPLDNEEQITLFLRSWWSRLYNRPLQDPLLLSYTFEQLLYEYYDRVEREAAEKEGHEQDEVKDEEKKEKENLDWAEKMEQEEIAQMKAKAAAAAGPAEVKPVEDPTKDPENVKWMEEQIKLNKRLHGESFGEDVEMDFE